MPTAIVKAMPASCPIEATPRVSDLAAGAVICEEAGLKDLAAGLLQQRLGIAGRHRHGKGSRKSGINRPAAAMERWKNSK